MNRNSIIEAKNMGHAKNLKLKYYSLNISQESCQGQNCGTFVCLDTWMKKFTVGTSVKGRKRTLLAVRIHDERSQWVFSCKSTGKLYCFDGLWIRRVGVGVSRHNSVTTWKIKKSNWRLLIRDREKWQEKHKIIQVKREKTKCLVRCAGT